jgi:hypothetical protein
MNPGRQLWTSVILLAWLGCSGPGGSITLPEGVPLELHLERRFELTADRTAGSARTLRFDSGSDRVRVKVRSELNDEEAKKKATGSRFLVADLFAEKASPYPGAISKAVACSEKFQPVSATRSLSRGWILSFRLHANQMRAFGVCSERDIHYDSALVHLYCSDTRMLFEVRAYTPAGRSSLDLDSLLGSLDCAALRVEGQ